MNKFERKIYDRQFATQLDFFTRMSNQDLNVPLDYQDYEQEELLETKPKKKRFKLTKKVKKVLLLITAIVIACCAYYGYTVMQTNSERDEIINFTLNKDSAQRLSNARYFIDSKKEGYLVLSESSDREDILSDIKNKIDSGDIKLQVNSLPFINLASVELKKIFNSHKSEIYSWLNKIDEISYQSSAYASDMKEIQNLPTTQQRISAQISFYKSHGLMDSIQQANDLYAKNKAVFDNIGDFDVSSNKFKTISFDQLSPSENINYTALLNNLVSYTDDKYRHENIIQSKHGKIISQDELKSFSEQLENMNLPTIENKYGVNIDEYQLPSFTNAIESLKKSLRGLTGVKQNKDNDLNQKLMDQSFIQKVKSMFKVYDNNGDYQYCVDTNKQMITDSDKSEEDKNASIDKLPASCNELVKNRMKKSPNDEVVASGIDVVIPSKTYQTNINGVSDAIKLVVFDSTSSASKFISTYEKSIKELAEKKANAEQPSMSSILYNGTNMLFLLPNGADSTVQSYLSQLDVASWSHYDYHEQLNDLLKDKN